jgi:Brp/Blh family beta-carotene 15,15'-monooxygenase
MQTITISRTPTWKGELSKQKPEAIAGGSNEPDLVSSSWLALWQQRHTQVMLCVVLFSAFVYAAGGTFPAFVQVGIFAIGAAVLGVPHGAMDYFSAKEFWGPKFGRWGTVLFYLWYIGFALAVLAAWHIAPLVTLTVFLVVSAFHWGAGDVKRNLVSSKILYWAEVLARGAMPILVPWFFFPQEIEKLYLWTLPPGSASEPLMSYLTTAVGQPLFWMMALVLTLVAGVHLVTAVRRRSTSHAMAVAEIGSLGLLFSLVTPLEACILYFCGLHSARYTLQWAAKMNPHHPGEGLRSFAQKCIPLTLITLAIAYGSWSLLSMHSGILETSVRVVIVGLSLLTFPHIVVTAVSEFKGVLPSVSHPEEQHLMN